MCDSRRVCCVGFCGGMRKVIRSLCCYRLSLERSCKNFWLRSQPTEEGSSSLAIRRCVKHIRMLSPNTPVRERMLH